MSLVHVNRFAGFVLALLAAWAFIPAPFNQIAALVVLLAYLASYPVVVRLFLALVVLGSIAGAAWYLLH